MSWAFSEHAVHDTPRSVSNCFNSCTVQHPKKQDKTFFSAIKTVGKK
jgi:hypothetical protein